MTAERAQTQLVRHPLTIRLLQVRRTEPIARRMVRVTLHGDNLDGFVSLAPDDHVKLFFPAPDQERPVLPRPGPQGLVYPNGAPRPAGRDYTPRRYRPEQQELDIDFALHGEGPGAAWAEAAIPGRYVGVAGPRGSLILPPGFDWYLLAADESGLPATARMLEELPAGTRAFVFVEVAGRDDELPLPAQATTQVTWLHRGNAGAGTTAHLLDAVRSLALPDGFGYAWAAAEAEVTRALRSHLRDERHLSNAQVKARGYWKRGVAGHQEPHDD